MTESGLSVMPKEIEEFSISSDILSKLKEDEKVWINFINFPLLYQRIRVDNIEWARSKKNSWTKNKTDVFNKRLDKLIIYTKENKMYGEWNDYGRLS